MTDTPAESAEAPRTPEELASEVSWQIIDGPDWTPEIAAAIRAALAARDAEVRKLLRRIEWAGADEGSAYCVACCNEPPRHREDCELDALLSEGKPGK